MRAWLLLLAVLATFLTIVQVASTEDISARFITAIKPIEGHTHRAATRRNANANAKQKQKSAATTTAILKTTTALSKVFNPSFDLAATSSSSTASSGSASSMLIYKSSDKSDKQNEHAIAEIIEIKSINRIENEVNKVQSIAARTDQLESSQSRSKKKHKKMKNEYRMAISDESVRTSDEQQQQKSQQQKQQKKHHHTRHHKQRKESKAATTTTTTRTTTTTTSESPVIQLESHALAATTSGSDEDASSLSSSSSSLPDEIIASVEVPANAVAMIEEDEPATYSNQEIIQDKVKLDRSALVEIEKSLLSIFKMKRPPKIDRSKIIIPEAMKQLYKQMTGQEVDSVNMPRHPDLLTKNHANTMRSFTHKDSKIDDRFPHHHRFRLHFDVKSIPSEEKLKAAELQLARDTIGQAALHPRQAQRTRYQVLVYDITRVGVRGKREPNYLLLDSKTVRLNSNDTVSLDVQPAVDRWLATPQRNYGLLVEVRTMRSLKPAPHHHVRLRRSVDEPHEQWQHKQPLLYTYTDDGRPRSKRAGGHHRRPHRRKNNMEICRRHSLYVDFEVVGWSDWIVAPPGYDAFLCQGRCPFPLADHLNSTNHAVVQTLVHNLNPAKVPEACCVPTQLEGISMLYLNDQSTVVLKNYQDMAAVACGCR